ncbi:MAG: hypothetical protein IJS15_17060, partial [Victivallales bacterium]|nr:hypothetical protein [Victivallales bacterium]
MEFPVSTEFSFYHGRPHIIVNGESIPPLIYGLSDIPASRTCTAQAKRNIANFARAGIHLVQIDTDLRFCWLPEGIVDSTPVINEIAGALEANPHALVIIRLHLNPPVWWMDTHPDEMNRFADGPGEAEGFVERQISRDLEKVRRVSLASRLWLDECGKVLATVCREVSETSEGAHVVGIQVACGVYGEWHQWGFLSYDPDYSLPMLRRFRQYLREKYVDDETLARAWNCPTVCIDNATIPMPEMRLAGDDGVFRDPSKSMHVMDSLKCQQLVVPEAILHFAEIIKATWGRKLLVGAFYGYFFSMSRASVGGHLETHMLLDSPFIDYLCGPLAYIPANRAIDGPGHSRTLMKSIRIHRKLWLTEMDQPPIGTADFPGSGAPEKLDENIAILRRNIMEPLNRGMGAWFYDHRIVPGGSLYEKTGWWESPELLAEIAHLKAEAKRLDSSEYIPKAETALVYDTEMFYHISTDTRFGQFSSPTLFQPILAMHQAGMLFDCVNLQDLERVEWQRYKNVVFVATPLLTPKQKQFI